MPQDTIGELLPARFLKAGKRFRPCAGYFSPMDYLICLEEDVSYRAKQISPRFDVLLHPYEDRIIGIKVCGFAGIVEQDLPRILTARQIAWTLLRRFGMNLQAWYERRF